MLGTNRDREPEQYLDAMSAYFRTYPYRSWFGTFEPLLNGAGSSYYANGEASTALHTDICSAIATDPTWTGLTKTERASLEEDGGPLWHMLLEALCPQVVFLSVEKRHLGRIRFVPLSDWHTVHVFDRKGDGAPRKRPYEIEARWYEVCDERSLFVFGQAARKPFGNLHNIQKRKTGVIALGKYKDGR